ncbi:hypothetical protein NECID01_2170, partial [Nematocida sp. AWRm77]
HSVTAMNNPEYQEGVRKRANDQPSTSQFDEASLTKHSMSTKEIEDGNAVFNRRVEWPVKNQNSGLKTVLAVAGVGAAIWILSQLIIFASTEAASMDTIETPIYKYLFRYYNKHPFITYQNAPIAVEELAAPETAQENEVLADVMQTIIETTTLPPSNSQSAIYKKAIIGVEALEEAVKEELGTKEVTTTMQTIIEPTTWAPYNETSPLGG